jgi:hypothetical protein
VGRGAGHGPRPRARRALRRFRRRSLRRERSSPR